MTKNINNFPVVALVNNKIILARRRFPKQKKKKSKN